MSPYYLFFGLGSAITSALAYWALYARTTWNPYAVWIAALSLTTFGLYGLDKALAKAPGAARAPEMLFHVLALAGGFPGGWLGRAVFHHKTNLSRHLIFPVVLVLSTLGHAALLWYWFLRRGA